MAPGPLAIVLVLGLKFFGKIKFILLPLLMPIATRFGWDPVWFGILLTLMISSKGVAAVPRASLVVITGTLAMFGLPVEGVAIILAIDQFLDMGRTVVNVMGDLVCAAWIESGEPHSHTS